MRILITTDLYETKTNGVVTSVNNLISSLTAKGYEVRVLTLSNSIYASKNETEYFLPSLPIGIYPNVRMPLCYRHKFIKELIEWKPDIIHSQCEFFSLTFAKRISRKSGAPIVHTFHTIYEYYVGYVMPLKRIRNRLVRWFVRKRLKNVSSIIAPTQKIKKLLLDYGIKQHLHIVPSGISLEQHKDRLSPEIRASERKSLGIAPNITCLVYVGRIAAEKNLSELLDYFAKSCNHHPNLKLLIVGDGPYKKELEQYSEALNIQENVIFTGMVSPENVHLYYQLGDIFVSSSTSESQGLTYIEAMANGLPLLCRKDDCLENVILQGKNGFQYKTAKDFEQMLQSALEKSWQTSAAEKSREIAKSFDIPTFGNAVEKVYFSVKKD